MALTSILAPVGKTMTFQVARGNVGVITAIVAKQKNNFTLPALGGSCTYPSENDVRNGTSFGDIYTGNLTLPLEVDVETGVQYGTNGTEFTGTFIGGGGFISIVNE